MSQTKRFEGVGKVNVTVDERSSERLRQLTEHYECAAAVVIRIAIKQLHERTFPK